LNFLDIRYTTMRRMNINIRIISIIKVEEVNVILIKGIGEKMIFVSCKLF